MGYYDPGLANTFDASEPFNVVVGFRKGAESTGAPRAFFFLNGAFLGNDDPAPSAGITMRWRAGDTIALEYTLYRPNNPQCCATGGAATVRYRLRGRSVVRLDRLPPASFAAPLSRR